MGGNAAFSLRTACGHADLSQPAAGLPSYVEKDKALGTHLGFFFHGVIPTLSPYLSLFLSSLFKVPAFQTRFLFIK